MWIAALFNMQMAGGDCMWRLQNGTKRCDSKSWFAPLVDWLMQRLFTHAASLFSLCMSLRFCLRLCVPWVYVHMYAHMCVYLFSAYDVSSSNSQGLSPSSSGSEHSDTSFAVRPLSLHSPSPHPSHWGFHAPNREIHPHSQLCLQSEPSQS